jgi:hypothetical protein
MEFSPSSNYAVVDRLDLAMTHNCLRNLISRAGVFVERSEPSLGGHFTRYGAGLGSRYLLTDNIDLDFSADWSKRNSTDLGFDTKLVEASIGVTIYLAR